MNKNNYFKHHINMIYIIIFVFKLIENTLSTIRIIVINQNKKILGATLQGIITLVWAISANLTIINFQKDYLKIFVFCLGAFTGSLLGSYIEEKKEIILQSHFHQT